MTNRTLVQKHAFFAGLVLALGTGVSSLAAAGGECRVYFPQDTLVPGAEVRAPLVAPVGPRDEANEVARQLITACVQSRAASREECTANLTCSAAAPVIAECSTRLRAPESERDTAEDFVSRSLSIDFASLQVKEFCGESADCHANLACHPEVRKVWYRCSVQPLGSSAAVVGVRSRSYSHAVRTAIDRCLEAQKLLGDRGSARACVGAGVRVRCER